MMKPRIASVSTRTKMHQPTSKADAHCFEVGDVDVPWNVGKSIFRLKAARDMVVQDITIDTKEIVTPSGAPICLEAWKNGQYAGDQVLTHGAISLDKSLTMKKLDEIELRIVVKGDGDTATSVKGLWVLYNVI